MDLAEERRAIAFFELAQDWPDETRELRLQEALAGEPALLRTVRAMLRADAALLPTIPPDPRSLADEEVPARLGAYRVLGELGRGGMGVVYRAARDDGLYDREVAIKLLRRSLFSAAAGEHFARERRILGKLRHPHIAQILDAGLSEDGRAYIVMELIEGLPVTVAADLVRLDLRGRILLLREICEAVDFAHRNFVAHGDIKPSNVIWADGFGSKLLDFGIAGLLEPEASPVRAASSIEPFTPGYASPERRRGGPASVAGDVYSLGALMRDLIVESAPNRDLDAVAACALEPEPEERYPTAKALIDELDRWLGSRPVRARRHRGRDILLYARRHRLGIGIAATTLAALVGVSAITTSLYLRADAARTVAERRFEETRSLARYMLDDVTDSLESLPGSSGVRRGIAERAQAALRRLRDTGGGDEKLALDDGEAYARVGQILADIDVSDPAGAMAAEAALARAEADLQALPPALAGRPDARLALADTLVSRALLAMEGRHREREAMSALDRADRLLDPLVASYPRSRHAAMARLSSALARAQVLDHEGEFGALAPVLARADAQARAIPPGNRPGDRIDWLLKKEQLHSLRGDQLYYAGDKAGALDEYRRGAGMLDEAGALGSDARVVFRQAFVAFNVASTLSEHGRSAEALGWIERGVAAAARLRTFEDSPRARHVQNIVTMEHAVELKALGRFGQAIEEARTSIAGREARVRLQPANYEARRAVPVGLRPLAELYVAAGRRQEGCAAIVAAQRAWQAIDRSGGLTEFDRNSETPMVRQLIGRWRCASPA